MRLFVAALLAGSIGCSRSTTLDESPCPCPEAGVAGAGWDGGDPGPSADGSAAEARIAPPPSADLVGPAPLRLLTRLEYNNTIRDLLGDTSAPADRFHGDIAVGQSGFSGGSWLTAASDARQHLTAATQIASAAVSRLPQLLPLGCSVPAGATEQDDCARKFIAQFGQRAFRRPLSDAEALDLFTLYMSRRRADVGSAFADAIRVVIGAMLQSPYFLYHWQLGSAAPIKDGPLLRYNPYELASRLSYFLWASMPDERLFAAAASGELGDPTRIAQEARRLLQDPKARDGIGEFHVQWLELSGLPEHEKDAVFTNHSPQVAKAMLDETRAFVADLLLGPAATGKLETLLTSNASFIDGALAPLYGVPGVTGSGLRPVTLDPAQRAGVLTHASFLTAHAGATDSSPPWRGSAALERVLCFEVPPPANVVIPALPDPLPGQTTREIYETATKQPCAQACHVVYEVGFAFENYDPIGAYRTQEQGKRVDASGMATVGSNVFKFNNAIDLVKQLAQSEDVRACVARQWLRYLVRRRETPGDEDAVRAGRELFRSSGFDLRELVVALTRTRVFTHRSPSAGEVLP